jgi:hypothetical protein
MLNPLIIPLACFAMVVLIVAIVHVVKIRDKELDAHQKLYQEQLQHQLKMKELELEMERVRHGV